MHTNKTSIPLRYSEATVLMTSIVYSAIMIKIITLAFESANQCFNDEVLQRFIAGKNVKIFKPEFFQ